MEPDVSVVCDHDRLDDSGCNGVPEWVIEVVSPSSRKMDYERKLKLYRESGVDEYWIVDPMEESVSVYRFAEGEQPERYTFSDVIKSGIFKELEINLKGLQEYIL